jgi:hypothetical protein
MAGTFDLSNATDGGLCANIVLRRVNGSGVTG